MELVNIFPLASLSVNDFISIFPILIMAFGALIALLVGTHKERGHALAFAVTLATLLVAITQTSSHVFDTGMVVLGKALIFDSYTKTLSLMILFFSLIATMLTYGQDQKEGFLSEVYGLILFATAGMILMVSSLHLVFTFIALEIMSLAVYVLVAMRRTSRFSSEAGLKYFILGGLGSGMLLYGSALVFGATGSFELTVIRDYLLSAREVSFIYYIGLGLIVVAMLFKVGAFPFHGWVPDVYQGASTNITGFMGAAVKFTAFMAFVNIARYMVFVNGVVGLEWFQTLIWFASAASMIYGNFVAISQSEIKRMLSFSTIAHTGYLLMGLLAMNGGVESSQSMILYLFFYALTNLGAFAVISLFEERNQKDLTIDQMAGLGAKYPLLGGLMTIFLLSMAGIPLTSGFIGKYGLFNAAVNGGQVPLVVIAVLTSVVSVYYYLRVIVYMFMKESDGKTIVALQWKGASIAALVSAAATIQFGLFPKMIIQFVKLLAR
jgi:NADH-quinone oxidoreductase subunit N